MITFFSCVFYKVKKSFYLKIAVVQNNLYRLFR